MGDLITGLDIGGAHLKGAQVDRTGRVTAAVQLPCALWQGLDRLQAALAELRTRLRPGGAVAVTMTGELADLFADRAQGVGRLLDATAAGWPGELMVWAGKRGFLDAAAARRRVTEVASANWLASGSLAAQRSAQGVFVDIGSTTTDVLVLAGGAVAHEGSTDRDRLASGELVYSGLTRTPVMALAGEAPFAGRRVAVMNELFATTADVYRVLRLLPEAADQHPAADGGAKTPEASARRLARMIGADLDEAGMEQWCHLAAWFARCQQRRIEDGIALQLSRGLLSERASLIGAGCGRFLVERLAQSLDRPYRDFAELIEVDAAAADQAACCAPAVAVALLLHEAGRGNE
jgi:(4-(4-[2-(gamma-L-glutamylamino)ethyl]phenoxymethyl)furan-2-yl)methanamine synthase